MYLIFDPTKPRYKKRKTHSRPILYIYGCSSTVGWNWTDELTNTERRWRKQGRKIQCEKVTPFPSPRTCMTKPEARIDFYPIKFLSYSIEFLNSSISRYDNRLTGKELGSSQDVDSWHYRVIDLAKYTLRSDVITALLTRLTSSRKGLGRR